jgi:hypothetical protein
MSKPKWLDRSVSMPGPYLTLCLSEREFKDALRHIKFSTHNKWIKTERANATTHFMVNEGGETTCIVCMRDHEGRNPIEVAGLLVHEAVHIWQDHAQSIGEEHPGWEQEAYAIQSIAQELMAEFARRMK